MTAAKKKPRELSWNAVRRGNVYCAPACGHGCTRAAFEAAKKAGAALAKQLGKGWRARVWENLGWHYCAVSACGRWKVHPNIFKGKIESYSAFLGEGSHGGRWIEHGRTPQSAIRNTRAVARAEARKIAGLLDMASNT